MFRTWTLPLLETFHCSMQKIIRKTDRYLTAALHQYLHKNSSILFNFYQHSLSSIISAEPVSIVMQDYKFNSILYITQLFLKSQTQFLASYWSLNEFKIGNRTVYWNYFALHSFTNECSHTTTTHINIHTTVLKNKLSSSVVNFPTTW